MKRMNRAAQGGFSLIELLVSLALLTILAVAISGAFDGSRSRAQSLLSMMSELGSAQQRQKNDTGCYGMTPAQLSDRAKATSTVNFCNKIPANTWNGPYVTSFTVDSNGSVVADKISEGATVSFPAYETSAAGKRYFVHADGIPGDVAKQFLQECNGKVDAAATFDTAKCRASNIASDGSATVDMLYDTTR